MAWFVFRRVRSVGREQHADVVQRAAGDIRRAGYRLKRRIACVCGLAVAAIAGMALTIAVDPPTAPLGSPAAMAIALGAAAIALTVLMALMLGREIGRRVDREIALGARGAELMAANDCLTEQHKEMLAASAALAVERLRMQQANAELALSKTQAEEASRAKSSFLANMSHELRTPLNAIIGFSEIIGDRIFGDDLPRYCEYAADIRMSGLHLLNIINGVLDVAKIEAGKLSLSETVVPLDALIARSLPLIAPQAASGEVEIVLDVPDDATSVRCDETRLKQILINLLSNAVKFTAPGGRVTLRARHGEDGGLMLQVADTGIGMTAEEMACALEVFGQVDNRLARRYQGTGLGLPLAVRLAELHEAPLRLDSTPGVGTVVSLPLPPDRVIRCAKAREAAEQEAERRRADRDPVTHVVFVHSNDKGFASRTVDVSRTGMRIERVEGFSVGQQVLIEMDGATAEGLIVWQNRDHVGVRFLDAGHGIAMPPASDGAGEEEASRSGLHAA